MRRRRVFRPAPVGVRRAAVRRPLGTLLIAGAAAGVAYKLGKGQAEQIEEYTGVPPDQLSEEDLRAAMEELDIQPEPLTPEEQQALAQAEAQTDAPPSPSPEAPATSAPAAPPPATSAPQPDYIDELQRLAQLRDAGIITSEEFEAKKRQLLGL
jgi:hypothetical protein